MNIILRFLTRFTNAAFWTWIGMEYRRYDVCIHTDCLMAWESCMIFVPKKTISIGI